MRAKTRSLSNKEKNMIELAKIAFNRALADFYFPPSIMDKLDYIQKQE